MKGGEKGEGMKEEVKENEGRWKGEQKIWREKGKESKGTERKMKK